MSFQTISQWGTQLHLRDPRNIAVVCYYCQNIRALEFLYRVHSVESIIASCVPQSIHDPVSPYRLFRKGSKRLNGHRFTREALENKRKRAESLRSLMCRLHLAMCSFVSPKEHVLHTLCSCTTTPGLRWVPSSCPLRKKRPWHGAASAIFAQCGEFLRTSPVVFLWNYI